MVNVQKHDICTNLPLSQTFNYNYRVLTNLNVAKQDASHCLGRYVCTAMKVLHTSLPDITAVSFKVLPLGSSALMAAPSPPFKTILELVLWNGLQSCCRLTPDVIKMPTFQYFLYLREQKKVIGGIDPVNREVVPAVVYQLKHPHRQCSFGTIFAHIPHVKIFLISVDVCLLCYVPDRR
jgi:hypothetical protein